MALHGIDIYNKDVGIDLVGKGFDFVIIKASQGMRTPDREFERFWAMSDRAGIKLRGAYHFADATNAPEDDAALFLSKVKPMAGYARFLPVLDWEPGEAYESNVDWCVRWIKKVKAELGLQPHIYMNRNTAHVYRWQPVRDLGCLLWMAQYGGFAEPDGWAGKIFMHQYTETGRVPGFDRDVDLDNLLMDWPMPDNTPAAPSIERPDVYGEIGDKWRALGGSAGPLGAPTTDELDCSGFGGRYRHFEHGAIVWTRETGARVSKGAIREKWAELHFETGPLGFPTTDEQPIRDGGFWQDYQNGAIYWSPKTGAHPVWGEIRKVWAAQQWEWGLLGYPVTDEFDGIKKPGKVQDFEHGTIYWTPEHGAWTVSGAIKDIYARNGYEGGSYGYPIDGMVFMDIKWVQRFEGGYIEFGNPDYRAPAAPRAGLIKIPTIHEDDPKVWCKTRGSEGWDCVCVQIVLPLAEQALLDRGLIRESIDWFQWGYNRGGVGASAGTHDEGGVGDIGQWTLPQRRVLCEFGIMPWPRTTQFGWTTGDHCHFGLYGCVHRAPYLAWQVGEGLKGMSALANNTYMDFEHPTQTWQDALVSKGLAYR